MSTMPPALWSELSEYQRCVLAVSNSGDGSGLPDILAGWDPWYQPSDLPAYIRDLSTAIIALVSWEFVVVTNGMTADAPVMSFEEIELATANPQNWYSRDEGTPQFLWVASTESGDRFLTQVQPGDVLKYFDRRHSEREHRNAPPDHG